MESLVLVVVYLAATVLANLAVTWFGPGAAIPAAFLLIGLDLTTRDGLHERWRGRGLWPRMLILIAAGGVLSYVINHAAARIAVASFLAFVASGATDAVTYHLLRGRPRAVRVNASNTLSAAVDSTLFPTLAFGVFLPGIVAGQFLAKVAGGYVWSLVLGRTLWRADEADRQAA